MRAPELQTGTPETKTPADNKTAELHSLSTANLSVSDLDKRKQGTCKAANWSAAGLQTPQPAEQQTCKQGNGKAAELHTHIGQCPKQANWRAAEQQSSTAQSSTWRKPDMQSMRAQAAMP